MGKEINYFQKFKEQEDQNRRVELNAIAENLSSMVRLHPNTCRCEVCQPFHHALIELDKLGEPQLPR